MCISMEARGCCWWFSRKARARRRPATSKETTTAWLWGARPAPLFFGAFLDNKGLATALCYTRCDGFVATESNAARRSGSQETVSCGRHGARLPGIFCADEPDERAFRHSHQGSLPFQYDRAAALRSNAAPDIGARWLRGG